MVRSNQPRPRQGMEQISPLPSQELEPSRFVRFDLRNLNHDGS